MKKRRRLKKGLAMLLSLAMVVGLLLGVGTMKVFAAGTTSASGGEGKTAVTLTPLYGYPAGGEGATYDKILDGETGTRWKCDNHRNGNPSYVIFKASVPINVNGYSMWTAHDTTDYEGNPMRWTLYGCNDYDEVTNSGGTWKEIHTVSYGDLPKANEAEKKFTFDTNKTTYQYFKLNIIRANVFKLNLGEFALTYCDHTWGSPLETLAPTCIEDERKVYQCSICQTTKRESTGQTALGHDFINGVCSRCHNGSTEPTKPEEKTGYTR